MRELRTYPPVAAIGGCGCVWWTSRGGGPRWAQALALVTLTAGEFLRFSAAPRRRPPDAPRRRAC
nr:hypothetical protein [Streptomyces hygroscopicus]